MARRYGKWAGNPQGTPERVGNCLASVVGHMGWRSRGFGRAYDIPKQCDRRATHDLSGASARPNHARLCWQHAKRVRDAGINAVWIPEDKEATT
jgi:hypothetical protein